MVVGWGGLGGYPCDYCVTPVPIGLGFWTALGLGLRGLDLGLGLDNCKKDNKERQGKGHMRLALFGAMLVVIA